MPYILKSREVKDIGARQNTRVLTKNVCACMGACACSCMFMHVDVCAGKHLL